MTDLHWLPTIPDWRTRLRALARTRRAPGTRRSHSPTRGSISCSPTRSTRCCAASSTPGPPDFPPGRFASRCSAPPRWRICCRHPRRRAAPRNLDRHLRERLRPVPAGTHRPGLRAARVQADHGAVRAGRVPPRGRRQRGPGAAGADAALHEIMGRIREFWRLAREAFRCPIIQQTALPVLPTVLGSNERRLPGSRARFLARLNAGASRHGRCRRRRSAGAR